MKTIADRVRFLVDKHHGGSVNRAAKAMHLKQQTLHRIVEREVEPRLSTVAEIARRHEHEGVTIEWLLLGKGPGPGLIDEIPHPTEALQWGDLVIGLKLPEPAHSSLLGLPGLVASAAVHWHFEKQGRGTWRQIPGHPTARVGVAVSPAIVKAVRLEHQALILLLQDFIEAVGIQKVRSSIIASEVFLKARFVPEAIFAIQELRAKEYDERVAAGSLPPESPFAKRADEVEISPSLAGASKGAPKKPGRKKKSRG